MTDRRLARAAAGWPPRRRARPVPRMVTAQAWLELRALLRNGEQLLLTLIIPVVLLIGFSLEHLINGTKVDFLVPGIIALGIMSTAFTSQAIATGFERHYGVLKRLGATPLRRGGLIAAKTSMVIVVELGQTAVIIVVGLLLGWSPDATPAAAVWVPLLILAGTAAFSGLALLLAGTLRPEATLAAANLIYLVLLGRGRGGLLAGQVPGQRPAGAAAAAHRGAVRRAARRAAARRRAAGQGPGRAAGLGGGRDRGDHPGVPLGVAAEPRQPGRRNALLGAVPPPVLVVTGIVSVQVGAGLADRLFTEVPPAAVTGLRLWTAALVLAVAGARGLGREVRALARPAGLAGRRRGGHLRARSWR